MRGIVKIFVLGFLVLAVLSASAMSWALPKRATLMGGECNCHCFVDGGAGSDLLGLITGLSNSFGSCSVYNSKTCNVQDPRTGGVRSGTTTNCCQVQDNGTCRDSLTGAIVQAPTSGLTATLTTTTTVTPTAPSGTLTRTP